MGLGKNLYKSYNRYALFNEYNSPLSRILKKNKILNYRRANKK